MDSKKPEETEVTSPKLPYLKPEIQSEPMMGFGAVCNGSTNGGRKDTTSGPDNFCNANRLMS